jgi:hypothetical protein
MECTGKMEKLSEFAKYLGLSPVKRTIHGNFSDASESDQKYVKRKCEMVLEAAKKIALEGLIPNDPNGVENLQKYSLIDDELKPLISCFRQETNEKARTLILTMIPEGKYSIRDIAEVFGCSRYKVDLAFKWRKIYGICVAPPPGVPEKRHRMELNKAKHFVDFLMSSEFLHISPLGTTMLKNADKSIYMAPKSQLTGLPKHAIVNYLSSCEVTGFQPLSVSSLWRILHLLNPSQRKQMSGLDNFVADGINGIETMLDIVDKVAPFGEKATFKASFKKIEEYLKIKYSGHCVSESNCASHCIKHSLSSENEKQFSQKCTLPHNLVCEDCEAIFITLAKLEGIVNLYKGTEKESITFDFRVAKDNILDWMRHLMRGKQQNFAKVDAYQNLTDGTFFFFMTKTVTIYLFFFCQDKRSGIAIFRKSFFQLISERRKEIILRKRVSVCM